MGEDLLDHRPFKNGRVGLAFPTAAVEEALSVDVGQLSMSALHRQLFDAAFATAPAPPAQAHPWLRFGHGHGAGSQTPVFGRLGLIAAVAPLDLTHQDQELRRVGFQIAGRGCQFLAQAADG